MAALDPSLPHQPRHPLARAANALLPQLGVDPRRPVGPPRVHVDPADPLRQDAVRSRPPRRRSLSPHVVPAGGDAQHPAHGGDRVHGRLSLHELVRRYRLDPFSLAAKKARLFGGSPRSSRSTRFSCRSCRSSSFSLLVSPARLPSSTCSWRSQLRSVNRPGHRRAGAESRPPRHRHQPQQPGRPASTGERDSP